MFTGWREGNDIIGRARANDITQPKYSELQGKFSNEKEYEGYCKYMKATEWKLW